MDENAKGRGVVRTLENHTHVFRQLIVCGECDKNYIATVDRPRSDGYRPSVYRCYNYVHNKKAYRTCTGAIGEVKLGPFVMNYIANLVRANEFVVANGSNGTEKELEETLLSGPAFKDVVGIVPGDLKYTYNALLSSTGNILFGSIKEPDSIEEDSELSSLKIEKRKLNRALDRLEDLYLFSDDSMSEKDYLIKKHDIEKRRESVNDKIKKRSMEFSKDLPGHDLSFMKKATQYLLAHSLVGVGPIDYNSMVKVVDKTLLQDFMQCIIKRIIVKEDKTISSIEFVNGMVHRFVYRG